MSEPTPVVSAAKHLSSVMLFQFTDLHLFPSRDGKLLGINTFDSLQQVFELALEQEDIPDAILATGDLAQHATAETYHLLQSCFETFCRQLRKTESAPLIPVYWLAGNHDEVEMMASHPVTEPINPANAFKIKEWQVLMLNSNVPGEVHGRLTVEELNRLDQALAQNPDRFTLVCLHHNPVPTTDDWMGEIGLHEADHFFEVIDRHSNVKGIVWGHIHQEFVGTRKGVLMLATPSTCFQFKPNSVEFALDHINPGFRWIHLLANGDIRTGLHRVKDFKQKAERKSKGY